MQNEQCGFCWDLKFDNQGNDTHDLKYLHDFTPIDYCTICSKSKYDTNGIPTHPEGKSNFSDSQNNQITHKFVSGINTKHDETNRKKKNVLFYIVLTSGCAALIYNMMNIIF